MKRRAGNEPQTSSDGPATWPQHFNEALVDAHAGAAYISQQWDPERIRHRYDSIYLYDATSFE